VTELTNWLVNAFNGEWIKVANPTPNGKRSLPGKA
jgi:dipeptidyl aminopeptidase